MTLALGTIKSASKSALIPAASIRFDVSWTTALWNFVTRSWRFVRTLSEAWGPRAYGANPPFGPAVCRTFLGPDSQFWRGSWVLQFCIILEELSFLLKSSACYTVTPIELVLQRKDRFQIKDGVPFRVRPDANSEDKSEKP